MILNTPRNQQWSTRDGRKLSFVEHQSKSVNRLQMRVKRQTFSARNFTQKKVKYLPNMSICRLKLSIKYVCVTKNWLYRIKLILKLKCTNKKKMLPEIHKHHLILNSKSFENVHFLLAWILVENSTRRDLKCPNFFIN